MLYAHHLSADLFLVATPLQDRIHHTVHPHGLNIESINYITDKKS